MMFLFAIKDTDSGPFRSRPPGVFCRIPRVISGGVVRKGVEYPVDCVTDAADISFDSMFKEFVGRNGAVNNKASCLLMEMCRRECADSKKGICRFM